MIDCIFYVKIGGKGLITIEDWVNIEKASTQKCKKEAHHGKFFTDTEPVMDEKSWVWIQKGYMKKETEGMLISAQGLQSLQKRYIRKKVDGEDNSEKCAWGKRQDCFTNIVD